MAGGMTFDITNSLELELDIGAAVLARPARIELRVYDGYIQWKLRNEADWSNLLNVTELQDAAAVVTPTAAQINSDGDLLFTLSNGDTLNAGHFAGAAGGTDLGNINGIVEGDGAGNYDAADILSNIDIEALITNAG